MHPGDYLLRTEIFEIIIEDLKPINYKATRVVFFIPGKLVCNYLGEKELFPLNYIIKDRQYLSGRKQQIQNFIGGCMQTGAAGFL